MAIQVSSFIVPKGGNKWYVLEDKYIKGGLQVATDEAERDAIEADNRKAGMLVVVQSTGKIYQLENSLVSWREFTVGGGAAVRQTAEYFVENLAANDKTEFSLELGRSSYIFSLAVDTPCTVEVFGTSAKDETNPYKFVAVSDQLVDDGSMILPDGTKWYGRRYSTFVNMEEGNATDIYFRVTNTDSFEKNIVINIQFLPIEAISL